MTLLNPRNIFTQRPFLIINLGCLVGFLVQLCYVFIGQMYPTHTEMIVERVDLSDIEFPVVFKICIKSSNKVDIVDRFNDVGYKDLKGYFKGESAFNSSVIGWAGHAVDGGVVGTVEGK